jgi:type VI secretion system VasD/TssJ family lipoprotein
MFTAVVGAFAVAAALAVTAGCGSACVAPGGRIRVAINADGDLNDAGQGPQHVRYQVWAVQDLAMYENADAASLAKDKALQEEGMGQVFANTKAWIKPGTSRKLAMSIASEGQFTHVAIAVAYPEARKTLVPLDCGEHTGYQEDDGVHSVTFTLGRDAVEAGGSD